MWFLVPVLGFLVVCGTIAAVRLFSIQRDLRCSTRPPRICRHGGRGWELGEARANLTEANGLLVSVNNQLYQSASLEVLGWLPVIDENVSSLQRSIGMALSLAGGGERLLQVAAPLEAEDGTLEVPLRAGAIPACGGRGPDRPRNRGGPAGTGEHQPRASSCPGR